MAKITYQDGGYLFEPTGKDCNLSVYEKYPKLCKAVGFYSEEDIREYNRN